MKHLLLPLVLLLCGCVRLPEGVQPVDQFELEKYLGTWYEIARLDHAFERGLHRVTAEYSRRDDGGVRVLNRGYSESKQRWQEAEGKAYFVARPDQGYLKVSFFGPFYGAYIILDLDRQHYRYALICGPDRSYLWILARTPNLDRPTLETLLAKAKALGFATEQLILVDHHHD
jgi:apolipoprotein D and lipocalin family protein